MQNRFIIARHTENLGWTNKLLNGEILVYNSGGMEVDFHYNEDRLNKKYIRKKICYTSAQKIPFTYKETTIFIDNDNIGRETGKWLEYLINYYDNYANLNIFLQAYPFDHITFKDINQSLVAEEKYGYIGGTFLDNNFESEAWIKSDQSTKHGYDQQKIYKVIYGDYMPERFDWRVGGQLFLTKESLLKNKKCYYEFLKNVLLEYEEDGPYCFERSWLTFLINSPEQYKT
jgi:hypothetical protein